MIIQKMYNEYTSTSPQLMHLYKLNGLYYPGSYILQRIYDNLNKENLNKDKFTTNDGVHINANASAALIGSHYTDNGIERWRRVYKDASSSSITSIDISFLSNLINIMDNLMKATNI